MAAPSTQNSALSENQFVADMLDEVAGLLGHQDASVFRVRAYRDAAHYLRDLSYPIRQEYERGGQGGLDDLPTIGKSIAATIAEILNTGRSSLVDRLRGADDPEKTLQTVPMIGPSLARHIHEDLGIETLEELEIAANDGRVASIKGIGPRRMESLRYSLSDMLKRKGPRQQPVDQRRPDVAEILAVDQIYRSTAHLLPTLKPRRFNPTGDARLPILHTERQGWQFTALFSNTAAAHRFGKTRDWVIIYYDRADLPEGQVTVVTERGGPLDAKRVIRGQEAACKAHYTARAGAHPTAQTKTSGQTGKQAYDQT